MDRPALALGLVASSLLSCVSATGNQRPEPQRGAPADICVAVMQRTRACEDDFVPGLMALRVKLDQPK